jgi:hypothetical protein
MPEGTPVPHLRSPANPSTFHQGLKAMARRARLEYLATELLRLAGALRMPVPILELYHEPPGELWQAATHEYAAITQGDDLAYLRIEVAREIAAKLDESEWEPRQRLFGGKHFAPDDIDALARTMLIPSALLAGISERQRTPAIVARIFQVPEPEAAARLHELGYLPGDSESRGGDTTH